MSLILMNESSLPGTIATGKGGLWWDTTSSLFFTKNDANRYFGQSNNSAIAAQGAGFAADTYVTDSDILLPGFSMQARSIIRWVISASKTGAGVATPIYTIRTGAARTTSDTSRLVLTGPAQTAIADIGTLTIILTVRLVSAVGVIQGTAWWDHRGTAASSTVGTGFANDATGHVEGTSGTFDNTALGGQFIGLSINGGASAAWTLTQVRAEAVW
jgi:hypothetical protein